MADSPWIYDVTAAQLEDAIIRKSAEVPVIVDLWGPSCQPCLKLGPILEKVVNEFNGRVVLAKINIEQERDVAMMFGVQSIPMVVAFMDGRPIDQFGGLIPEEQVRQWIERFVPSRAAELLNEGQELLESDPAAAESRFRESLSLEEHDQTRLLIAEALLRQSRDDECREIISALEARGFLEPEGETIKAQLEMRAAADESGGIADARAASDANPDDLSLQIVLAEALAVEKKYREAFEVLLGIVQRDRDGEQGEAAKDQMVKLFAVLGNENTLVSEFRRQLATALY